MSSKNFFYILKLKTFERIYVLSTHPSEILICAFILRIMKSHVCFFPLRFPKSGNEDLALSLTQWVFKEKGVLRVGAVKHNKQGEKEPPQAYTVFDMVVSTSVPTDPQFTQSQVANMGYIFNQTGKPLLDFKRLCLLSI